MTPRRKRRRAKMYLCSDKHAEVCYDQRDCPVCEAMSKISDMEDMIYDLKEEIEELKAEKEDV